MAMKCLILNNILWPITYTFLCNLGLLFPNLTELRINSCVFHPNVPCLFYQECNWNIFKKLEILDLQNTVLKDLAVEWLCRKCKNLKELYLKKPKYLSILLRWEYSPKMLEYLQKKHTSSCCQWWQESFSQVIDVVLDYRNVDRTSYSLLRVGEFIANNCNCLEIVTIRNYENISIENIILVFSLPKLKILDVTGSCSISKQDIEQFKLRKQDVKVISSFDTI